MAIEISVIVACRNERKDIGKCLEAIANQKFPQSRFEAIFVDGGSSDGTLGIIGRFKGRIGNLKILQERGELKSAANARNQGAKIAKGRVLVFFDADVIVEEDYLQEIHAASGKFGAASSTVKQFPSRSFWGGLRWHETLASDYLSERGEGIYFPNIFKKEVFQSLGGYDPRFRYGEDLVLLEKLKGMRTKIVHLRKAIVTHRDPETLGEIAAQSKFWGGGFFTLFASDPLKHLPRLALVIARALLVPLALIFVAFPLQFVFWVVMVFLIAAVADGIIVGYRALQMKGEVQFALLLAPFRMIRSFYFLQGFMERAISRI